MISIRCLLLASAVLGIGFDLARTGSQEYASRAEIAETHGDIGALRRYRENLRSATQRRHLARILDDPAVIPAEITRFRSSPGDTPWEPSVETDGGARRAFADDTPDPTPGPALADWVRTRSR